MSQINGYYSVVRYCPDPSRQEFVNIGVAIYSPQTRRVEIKLAKGTRRLSQVFGKPDMGFIKRLKKSLEESLRRESFASVVDLESYISRSANSIYMGPLRSMKIGNVAKDLESLMSRLVAEGPEKRPMIRQYLDKKILEAGVDRLLHKAVSIEIPSFDQSIHVPYAYQNGRYNLIAPVEFKAAGLLSKAGEKAIEGQVLHETNDQTHGALHLIVVAKFADETPEGARLLVGRIFQEHNVAMHTFDNIAPLFDDIRTAALQHGLIQ